MTEMSGEAYLTLPAAAVVAGGGEVGEDVEGAAVDSEEVVWLEGDEEAVVVAAPVVVGEEGLVGVAVIVVVPVPGAGHVRLSGCLEVCFNGEPLFQFPTDEIVRSGVGEYVCKLSAPASMVNDT